VIVIGLVSRKTAVDNIRIPERQQDHVIGETNAVAGRFFIAARAAIGNEDRGCTVTCRWPPCGGTKEQEL